MIKSGWFGKIRHFSLKAAVGDSHPWAWQKPPPSDPSTTHLEQVLATRQEAKRTSTSLNSFCQLYHHSSDKQQILRRLAKCSSPAELQGALGLFQQSLAQVEGAGGIDRQNDAMERFLRSHQRLRDVLTPMHETIFKQIVAQVDGGMLFLVQLRADLLKILRTTRTTPHSDLAALRALDLDLKGLLASWFSVGFLNFERITFENSSGALLEKIIKYEAVHPVGTIFELKRRLGNARRCFAFFHPSLPMEPLVFVHVALVKDIAKSMDYIRKQTEPPNNEIDSKVAIFYSISSTQPGLQGVDLGNFLIKQVASHLKKEHPKIDEFSTLSPIPSFIPWLQSKISHEEQCDMPLLSEDERNTLLHCFMNRTPSTNCPKGNQVLLSILQIKNWYLNESIAAHMEPILSRLAVKYIYIEKKRGKALCPVANFHIRNGAAFYQINWLADLSPKGLSRSAGMMVNYKYNLEDVEKNNENYLLHNKISIGSQPKSFLLS